MAPNIVGFCRFSFFGQTDTKLSYADRDAAFQALYDPARMETRFSLFERLFLPTIAGQTDPDFRLVVLSSACMPDPWRNRLAKLCADVPQIELVMAEGEQLGVEVRRFTTDRKLCRNGMIQFRIDDDDALSRNYIATLRCWAPYLRDASILTQPRGLMLFDQDDGPRCHPMYRSMTGAGFAYYHEATSRRTVFSFAHLSAGRRFPVVSDPESYAYIQSFTPHTDTAFRARRKIRKFLAASQVDLDAKDSAAVVDRALKQDFPMFTIDDLCAMQATASGDDQRAA